MSAALSRIQHLIALAESRGVEDAEARTAARIAVKLIHAHGIEMRDPSESASPPPRMIHSRYAGRCNKCGASYQQGELVAWTKGCGAAHPGCVRAHAGS